MRKGTRTVTIAGLTARHRALQGRGVGVSAVLLQRLGVAPWQRAPDAPPARVRIARSRTGRFQLAESGTRRYLKVLDYKVLDYEGETEGKTWYAGYVCRRQLARLLAYRPRPGMRFDVTVLP